MNTIVKLMVKLSDISQKIVIAQYNVKNHILGDRGGKSGIKFKKKDTSLLFRN